jgi:hypothetical protein
VFVKAECLQRAGSFKIRGATWRLMQLSDAERARGVVAYSSGNFAQGLAAAGKAAGVPVTIVMPDDAPEMKRRATEGFGARVVLSHHGDRPREEVASALARELSQTEGLALLHPFDDPAIVAGQAAVGLEAQEQLSEAGAVADLVLCPDYVIVGAGSAGCALAYRLVMAGKRVDLIEYGGTDIGPFIQMPAALSYPMNMRRYDWGFSSEPEPHLGGRRLVTPRGKVMGGSSPRSMAWSLSEVTPRTLISGRNPARWLGLCRCAALFQAHGDLAWGGQRLSRHRRAAACDARLAQEPAVQRLYPGGARGRLSDHRGL